MFSNRASGQNRPPRRWIFTYAFLVALCLILIAASSAPPIQDLRRGINFAVSPIQGTLAGAARSITSIFSAIGEIDQLRLENRSLGDRVAALESEIQQLLALKTENERLSQLLGLKATLEYSTLVASVIGRQTTNLERIVTLNRGTDAGVATGDPVLSEGGALIGVVTEAGTNYSFVMLISDPRSVVIGMDVTSRATGEVRGRLSALLEMGNIPTTEQIATEHTVVTAGIDLGGPSRAPFPPGLLIGRIVEVRNEPSAVVQTALIQPASNLDDLEHALVVTDFESPTLPKPGTSPAPGPSANPAQTQRP